LETDQIDGDTASRFNEFVLQRLGRKPGDPSMEREVDRKIVYIRPGSNRKFAVEIAKELKQVGFNPVLNPPPPLFSQPQHIVVLWGSQSQTKLLEEISAIDSSRKSAQAAGGKLILLMTSPPTKSKSEVLIIGMPYVDHIIDATECEDAVSVGGKLASALGGDDGLLGGKR
jgi:hypothetical protein